MGRKEEKKTLNNFGVTSLRETIPLKNSSQNMYLMTNSSRVVAKITQSYGALPESRAPAKLE